MVTENSACGKTYEFQKCFLEDIQLFWIANILVQFVPFNYRRREKGSLKEVMLYFEYRNIVSIFCVSCTHRSRNNIEWVVWTLVSENLKQAK